MTTNDKRALAVAVAAFFLLSFVCLPGWLGVLWVMANRPPDTYDGLQGWFASRGLHTVMEPQKQGAHYHIAGSDGFNVVGRRDAASAKSEAARINNRGDEAATTVGRFLITGRPEVIDLVRSRIR